VTTLQITFEKQNIVNEIITKQAFLTVELRVFIGSWFSMGSGWTIKSINEHYFNIVGTRL